MGGVGIFDAVVEQGPQNGIGVQSHFRHDLRHGQGVDDVRGAVPADLIFMFFPGKFHRPVDDLQVGTGHTALNGVHHGLIMFCKGLHRGKFTSLSHAAEAAWFHFW